VHQYVNATHITSMEVNTHKRSKQSLTIF